MIRTGCPAPGVWIPSPNNGHQFPNTPKHAATLWTTYVFPSIGLTIGGGASYVDKQYGDAANSKWIPSYTRWDAMASYAIQNNISLQLNVQNLTDKVYAATWAALLAIQAHNRSADQRIDVVAFPAMGTGFGGVPFTEAARQMAVAYRHFLEPPHRLDWDFVAQRQRAICYDGPSQVVR